MFEGIGAMTDQLAQPPGGDITHSLAPSYRWASRQHTQWVPITWPSPVWYLRGQDEEKLDAPDQRAASSRDGVDDSPDRWLLCIQCRAPIVSVQDARSHNGRQRHVFTNPNGDVFEIGCFSKAPGVITLGQPTTHATWFSGYTWDIALCRRCHQHLGWRYAGSDHFYGLILRALVEIDADP